MSLEVRWVKRGTPRVHARGAKVTTKKLELAKSKPLAAEAVVDISSAGMKLLARGKPPAKGEKLSLEIAHPALEKPVKLEGVVRWVTPGKGDRFTAGIEFQKVRAAARVQLERVVTLELGSVVKATSGQVGWVAPAAASSGLAGLFFVYDLGRSEVATIVDEKEYFHATRVLGLDVAHRQGTSLELLLRWVFDLKEGDVAVEPPLLAS